MKPPPFTYHDPATLPEALAILAGKDNARVLAGGQSLMPMLAMRFVLPDDVIDINGIAELSGIEATGGGLRIGAMTRQRDIEFSDVIQRHCPLMSEAILQVGHRQTRNRGTLGGSMAHLDPSAELPTVAMATEATIHVASAKGTRDIAVADFPAGYMTPSIELDEMVTAVSFPDWPDGHGYGFVEFARRHGDFAITSAAALLTLDGAGAIDRVSLTVSGVGPAPLRCREAEAMLIGQRPDLDAFTAASETCRAVDAMADVHASTEYRQHLATVMSRRALTRAAERAGGGGE
jgi:aerobic carbon-monoxide dehydrogenase medium subunit